MYKDSRKNDLRIKIITVSLLLIIFIFVFNLFMFNNRKNMTYEEIWGEEQTYDNIEFIEEELHPEILSDNSVKVISDISNNIYNNQEDVYESRRNYSDYYSGINTFTISTYSEYNKYVPYRPNIPITTASTLNIPDYHTGKIYYNDINEDKGEKNEKN